MDRSSRFARLKALVESVISKRPNVALSILPEHQMRILKDMIDTPSIGPGQKKAGNQPLPQGYEIFVAIRAADTANSPVSAAVLPPLEPMPSTEYPLALETGCTERLWHLAGPIDQQFIVRVRAGNLASNLEINDILSAITDGLLS